MLPSSLLSNRDRRRRRHVEQRHGGERATPPSWPTPLRGVPRSRLQLLHHRKLPKHDVSLRLHSSENAAKRVSRINRDIVNHQPSRFRTVKDHPGPDIQLHRGPLDRYVVVALHRDLTQRLRHVAVPMTLNETSIDPAFSMVASTNASTARPSRHRRRQRWRGGPSRG